MSEGQPNAFTGLVSLVGLAFFIAAGWAALYGLFVGARWLVCELCR